MKHRLARRCTCALLTAGVLSGLAGCGVFFPQEMAPVVPSTAFEQRFDAVCDSDAMISLRSLTTVEWDEVFVFPEGTSAEKFEAATGNPALNWATGSHTPTESLMVLQKDGKFVEIVQFLSGNIYGNIEHPSFRYDADVLVRMTETDHGCYGELVPAP